MTDLECATRSTTSGHWKDVAASLVGADESSAECALTSMLEELERLVHTNPAGAVSSAEDAIHLVDSHGSTELRLRARRMLAISCGHTNQFPRSLELCEQAGLIPGASDAPVELARIRVASMQALASLDRIDEAIDVGRAALDTLEAHGAGTPARMAALNIGASFAMTGRQAEALPYFDRARVGLTDNPVLLGQLETNRGAALAALDRFEEAEAAFEQAVDLLKADEMSWALAIAEENLADLTARQGLINRSLRHFEASRRYLEQDDAQGDLGRINAEQASVLAAAGLVAEAQAAYTDAIELIRQQDNPAALARAQVGYAGTLVDTNELGRAAEILSETGAMIDAEEHADIWLQYLALRVRLELAGGNTTGALTLITAGMKGVEGRPVQRLRWLILQSAVHRQLGETDEARATLHEALATAESTRVTPIIAEVHESLVGLERNAGNGPVADSHARQAIDALESIRGTLQADRLRQSFHHGRLDVYGDLCLSLMRQDDENSHREAFGVAERIRSRSLLDAMDAFKCRVRDTGSTHAVTESERPLADRLDAHRRWLNWMYSALADGHEPDATQQRELAEREHTVAILADRLALLRPQSGFDAPLALERVQSRLDRSTVILSYLAIGDHLTLQAISSERILNIVDLASLPEIAELTSNLQFQIGRVLLRAGSPTSSGRKERLRRDTDMILSRLYDALLAPVEPMLQHARKIIAIPTQDLHSIPFAALRHDGSYLVDRVTVVTSPSVSVLAGMGTPGVAFADRALVVAVPDEHAPGMSDEAARLRDRFPSGTFLLGEQATTDGVFDAVAGADLIHIACHGRFDSDHPDASGLRLADGWLTLARLRELRMDGALVVLTGCETGRVRVESGDDLVGMMAAIISAGAHGLVASLWKTHDVAANALVDAFYDAWERGADATTAMAISQRTVRGQFPHPAHWAPFIVTQNTWEEHTR